MKREILTGWRFHLGDEPDAWQPGFDDSDWRALDIPHDWQIEQPRDESAGGNQGFYPREGIGWYRKALFIGEELRGRALTLWFDALMQYSTVWINGHELGARPYGYVPVRYEITDRVQYGAENVIAVRLDTTAGGDRWYSGAGIIRKAYLYDQPLMRIAADGLHILPTLDENGTARVAVSLKWTNGYSEAVSRTARFSVFAPQRRAKGMRLIWQGEAEIAAQSGESGECRLSFTMDKPLMWDVDSPFLYQLTCALDGCDYSERFGIRSILFDKDEGFFLNGRSLKMLGGDVHHDGGEAFGAYCPRELWVRRLKAMKACGCNTIRCSHNPHDPVLYDLMDEMGFLCVDEYIDKWGRNDWSYQSQFFNEWHERDITDWINRDFNHPCIVIWSVGNEVEYQYQDDVFYDTAAELAGIVRSLDASRAVSMALIGFNLPGFDDRVPMKKKTDAVVRLSKIMDVIMMNYCESFYAALHEAGIEAPLLGSEVFTIYRSCEGQFRQTVRKCPIKEDIFDRPYVIGGLIWTAVDYLGECSWPNKYWPGAFLDAAGFEKLRAEYVRSIWSKKPMARIAVYDQADPWDRARNRWGFPQMRRHWNYGDVDRFMDVAVMTNCEKVALYLNDDVVRWASPKGEPDAMAHFVIPYLPGKVEVFGYDESGLAVAHDVLRTSEKKLSVALRPEKNVYMPGELALVEVWLQDEFGNPWVIDRPWMTVHVSGAGHLRALTNANFEDDGASEDRCIFIDGHALAAVMVDDVGTIEVCADVEGVGAAKAILRASKPEQQITAIGKEGFKPPED